MHTVLTLATILAASPASTRDLSNEPSRSARLMSAEELRAVLESFEVRRASLALPGEQHALRVSAAVLLCVVVAVPVVLLVGGLVGGLFGGLVALFQNISWASVFGNVMAAVFSSIPVWGWVTLAVGAAVGGALLITSIALDQGRQRQLRALDLERRAFLDAVSASSRPAQAEAPMTSLMTF